MDLDQARSVTRDTAQEDEESADRLARLRGAAARLDSEPSLISAGLASTSRRSRSTAIDQVAPPPGLVQRRRSIPVAAAEPAVAVSVMRAKASAAGFTAAGQFRSGTKLFSIFKVLAFKLGMPGKQARFLPRTGF